MVDTLLDEDGRCRKTDLLPRECGCVGHRGGEVVDLEEEASPPPVPARIEELEIRQTRQAKYGGRCSYDSNHEIKIGKWIAFVVTESEEEVGWVCEDCILQISSSGTVEEE